MRECKLCILYNHIHVTNTPTHTSSVHWLTGVIMMAWMLGCHAQIVVLVLYFPPAGHRLSITTVNRKKNASCSLFVSHWHYLQSFLFSEHFFNLRGWVRGNNGVSWCVCASCSIGLGWGGFFVCVYVKSAAFSSIVMDNDWNTGGTVQSYCIKFLGQ